MRSISQVRSIVEGYALNVRIQVGALAALQEGVEAYIVGLFKLKRRQPVCNICQEGYYNAQRLTIGPENSWAYLIET